MQLNVLKWIFIIFLLIAPLRSQNSGYSVSLSDTVVAFDSVLAGKTHFRTLYIENHSSNTIEIEEVLFEETTFQTDLSASVLPAGDRKEFKVFIESAQNLNYSDFLRIESQDVHRPLIIKCSAIVIYGNDYYAETQNKRGAGLKTALHNSIKTHTELDYGTLWEALRDTDEDPDNPENIIEIYTGWSFSKYENGGDPGDWNREHVWAKSHGDFDNDPPAGTDLHHIRPSDVRTNADRGNLDFDNGGQFHDRASECRFDGNSWEVRDAMKGDVARMMYYMTVRYEGGEGYDLELVEQIPSTTSGEPVFAKKSTLYQWHRSDTVDVVERRRNNRIDMNWQHNRNPFIDYPQLVDRLPDLVGGAAHVKRPDIVVTPIFIQMDTIGFEEQVSRKVAVMNTGDAKLHISDIYSTDPAFEISGQPATIAAESYDYFKVQFRSEQKGGVFAANVIIESNDADEASIQIPVWVVVAETVQLESSKLEPSKLKLFENFPNPFNPVTEISYRLPFSMYVTLDIYNLNGQKVSTLISGKQTAGRHHVKWYAAANIPSGLYIYRINADGRAKQKKMLLLR